MGHQERLSKKQKELRKDVRFKRKMDIKRVEILCDSLSSGISNQQIDAKLNSLPKIRPEKKEVDSLKKVKQSLRQISFISQIITTSSHGYEDTHLKYDLIAFLNGVNLDSIGIQVKSNPNDVKNFLKKINPNYPSVSNQEILNKRRLVLLNGQMPDSVIQEFFLKQFTAINNYYSTKNPI